MMVHGILSCHTMTRNLLFDGLVSPIRYRFQPLHRMSIEEGPIWNTNQLPIMLVSATIHTCN